METKDRTADQIPESQLERLTENLGKVEDLSKRLLTVLTNKTSHNPALDGPDQTLFAEGVAAYWTQALQNPIHLFEKQVEYWGHSAINLANAQRAVLTGETQEGDHGHVGDRRFANPFWDTNPVFHYIKEQYLTNAEAIEEAVQSIDQLDAREKQQLAHFTQQIIDLMAPTNFLPTNPDALELAFETGGESLVNGLENLVRDL